MFLMLLYKYPKISKEAKEVYEDCLKTCQLSANINLMHVNTDTQLTSLSANFPEYRDEVCRAASVN